MFGDGGITGYMDANLIESYARTFNQDPNRVYQEVDFGTIMMFAVKWKREHEHSERKDIIERMMAGDGGIKK